MTGSGTELDPYIIYDVDDLQAMYTSYGTRYSRPWDDNFGEAEQGGSWTIYPDPNEHGQYGIFWDKVDEATSDGDSTYIQATSHGAYCLLAHEGTPLSLPDRATDITVRIYARVRNTASGTSYIQGMVQDNIADYLIGSDTAISSTSYSLRSWTMSNPPWNPTLPWSIADVYALTTCGVGVKVSDASPNIRITQLYLRIDYSIHNYYELANDIDASITQTWRSTTDRGEWQPLTVYAVDDYVLVSTYSPARTYVCYTAHTSGSSFAITNWWRWYDDWGPVPSAFGFTPIDYFEGVLDGKGFTISGLYVNDPDDGHGLLFDWIEDCVIQNLTITDAFLHGGWFVGGLTSATWVNVSIVNCHIEGNLTSVEGPAELGGFIGCAYGDVTMERCSFKGSLGAEDFSYCRYIGGIVGQNRSVLTISDTFTDCYIIGYAYLGGIVGVTGWGGSHDIKRSYALGNIKGYDFCVGGIVGMDDSEADLIENCYATGDIIGYDYVGGFAGGCSGVFRNCYSVGHVTGVDNVGGFLGDSWGATIENCFWDTQTSRQATSAGGTGKTTAEMNDIQTFLNAGWDIEEVNPIENEYYPFLRWQLE